jgi:hypothetical protein
MLGDRIEKNNSIKDSISNTLQLKE